MKTVDTGSSWMVACNSVAEVDEVSTVSSGVDVSSSMASCEAGKVWGVAGAGSGEMVAVVIK